ncbi:hypothetical protein KR018_000305 [Drosophila ironensis]|nr:hypothetical protein KR018_000305 [Drosophila ironensis]
MSPTLRRYVMMLLVAASFVVLQLVHVQLNKATLGMLSCDRHAFQVIQEDLHHVADNCSIEKILGEDDQEFLHISCYVNDLPEGYERRLNPVDYGRSIFLNKRVPEPVKRKWNFQVAVDAVDGYGLLQRT